MSACKSEGRNELRGRRLCLALSIGSGSRWQSISELVEAEPRNPNQDRNRPQKRMKCYTTGRQTEGEIHKQITRQIDQEVVELSMQRITAVTTCDHRRNRRHGDRKKVTGVARERERERDRQTQPVSTALEEMKKGLNKGGGGVEGNIRKRRRRLQRTKTPDTGERERHR
ncbi:hypothetical protein Q8A73_017640 [Channa argus]|nr:hypothetical protein Q8A73_017640 [Channa argus]